MFCISLFVLLSFLFWPLCYLSFFDLRILIAPLVSSNSSYIILYHLYYCPYYSYNIYFVVLKIAWSSVLVYFEVCMPSWHVISQKVVPSSSDSMLIVQRTTAFVYYHKSSSVYKTDQRHGMYMQNSEWLFRQEMFEDTKVVIRSRKSKNMQCNGQKKKDNRTNNYMQNTTQKTKDLVTPTPLKTGGELGYSGKISSFCSTCSTRRCYSSYKPGDKSWMRKGPNCDCDKRNISVVVFDTDIP